MFKKNLILAAVISCFNIQTSNDQFQQKLQDFENRLDPAQQALLDACQKRINVLEEEEKSQHNHTNLCWAGAVVGILMIVLGNLQSEDKAVSGGITLAIGFSVLGRIFIRNEDSKAKMRIDEREILYRQMSSTQKK